MCFSRYSLFSLPSSLFPLLPLSIRVFRVFPEGYRSNHGCGVCFDYQAGADFPGRSCRCNTTFTTKMLP